MAVTTAAAAKLTKDREKRFILVCLKVSFVAQSVTLKKDVGVVGVMVEGESE